MLTLLLAFACGGDKTDDSGHDHDHDTGIEDTSTEDTGSEDTGTADLDIPDTYAFANDDGTSSVKYTGQVARHILISSLKAKMGDIKKDIQDDTYTGTANKTELMGIL